MDSVRFGRALGIGARSAAKALAGAADAASAPNPTPARPRPATSRPVTEEAPRSAKPAMSAERPAPIGPIASAARTAARATVQARRTSEGVARGSKRFGEAVWGPFVKLSGVLWLEITGAFFGIFALFAAQAVWTHRVELYSAAASRDDRIRVFIFLGMAAGFGYFCISSFVRARRRERRR